MSKANARYRRTVILGILALASLVWVAVDQFDIPAQDMAWLFAYTLMGAGFVIAIAGVVVGLWLGLRKLMRRGRL